MRLIIAGSRNLNIGFDDIDQAMEELPRPSVVICGEAKGPDTSGKIWAQSHGIVVWSLPAPWSAWGKGAGFSRNNAMSKIADAALIFWDGESRGTQHMMQMMEGKSKSVYVVEMSYEANAHPIKKRQYQK